MFKTSFPLQDSLRKKQQPPVSSTPASVPSPQPSPTFSPAIATTNTAQPTVQSLQQSHSDVKEVSVRFAAQAIDVGFLVPTLLVGQAVCGCL